MIEWVSDAVICLVGRSTQWSTCNITDHTSYSTAITRYDCGCGFGSSFMSICMLLSFRWWEFTGLQLTKVLCAFLRYLSESQQCLLWCYANFCIPQDQIEDYYDAYTLLADMFDESPLKVCCHMTIMLYIFYITWLQLTHRLLPGETLTFNNLRMLHARTAFQLNGGQRHFEVSPLYHYTSTSLLVGHMTMQGCYVNIDEYKNKLMVLSKRLGSTEPVRHVLNECWAASWTRIL